MAAMNDALDHVLHQVFSRVYTACDEPAVAGPTASLVDDDLDWRVVEMIDAPVGGAVYWAVDAAVWT